jgi:hypothetical protein
MPVREGGSRSRSARGHRHARHRTSGPGADRGGGPFESSRRSVLPSVRAVGVDVKRAGSAPEPCGALHVDPSTPAPARRGPDREPSPGLHPDRQRRADVDASPATGARETPPALVARVVDLDRDRGPSVGTGSRIGSTGGVYVPRGAERGAASDADLGRRHRPALGVEDRARELQVRFRRTDQAHVERARGHRYGIARLVETQTVGAGGQPEELEHALRVGGRQPALRDHARRERLNRRLGDRRALPVHDETADARRVGDADLDAERVAARRDGDRHALAARTRLSVEQMHLVSPIRDLAHAEGAVVVRERPRRHAVAAHLDRRRPAPRSSTTRRDAARRDHRQHDVVGAGALRDRHVLGRVRVRRGSAQPGPTGRRQAREREATVGVRTRRGARAPVVLAGARLVRHGNLRSRDRTIRGVQDDARDGDPALHRHVELSVLALDLDPELAADGLPRSTRRRA